MGRFNDKKRELRETRKSLSEGWMRFASAGSNAGRTGFFAAYGLLVGAELLSLE